MSPKPIHVLSEAKDKVAIAMGAIFGVITLINVVLAIILFVKKQTTPAIVLLMVTVVSVVFAMMWLRNRRSVLAGDGKCLSQVGRWTVQDDTITGLSIREVKSFAGKQLCCLATVPQDKCTKELIGAAGSSRSMLKELPETEDVLFVAPVAPGSVDAIQAWAQSQDLVLERGEQPEG